MTEKYEVLSYSKPTVYQVWDTEYDYVICTCTRCDTAIEIATLFKKKEENK